MAAPALPIWRSAWVCRCWPWWMPRPWPVRLVRWLSACSITAPGWPGPECWPTGWAVPAMQRCCRPACAMRATGSVRWPAFSLRRRPAGRCCQSGTWAWWPRTRCPTAWSGWMRPPMRWLPRRWARWTRMRCSVLRWTFRLPCQLLRYRRCWPGARWRSRWMRPFALCTPPMCRPCATWVPGWCFSRRWPMRHSPCAMRYGCRVATPNCTLSGWRPTRGCGQACRRMSARAGRCGPNAAE